MREYLFRFSSFYFASRGEEAMVGAAVKARLIATPPALHSACGLCLLVELESLDQGLAVLEAAHISHSGVYAVSKEGGHRRYDKIGVAPPSSAAE